MNRAKGDNLITLRKRAANLWPGTNGLYNWLKKAELEAALAIGVLPTLLCQTRKEEYEERSSGVSKVTSCKYCAQTGLEWKRDGYGKWHLHDAFGARHYCHPNDFEGHDTPDDDKPLPVPSREPDPFDMETCEVCGKAITLGSDDVYYHTQDGTFLCDKPKRVSEPTSADKPTAQAATQIANALQLLLDSTSGNVNADEVRAIVRAELANADRPQAVSLSLTINDLPPVSCDEQHERFPYLLALVAARVPVMLVGPAGSGKTTAAHEAAKALSLPFVCFSCGPLPQEARLLGYCDANGQYVRTALREAFENGGVFLFDEIDAAHPGTLVTLNVLLANSAVSFPDGVTVERHKDFVPIAGANTFGTGADRQYVGRNQLDAATLDRFFMLEWNYDEGFEAQLLGLTAKRTPAALGKSGYTSETWLKRVQTVRDGVAKHNIRHVISPRASLYGAKLLEIFPKELLEAGLLWKGLTDIQRKQIEGSK